MRFSIIIALFASALVLATPVQDATDSVEISQAEAYQLLDQFAAEASLSQDEALELLEQYSAYEAIGQEAEFGRILGAIGKAAKKVLPKVATVAKKVLPKVGKAILTHGPELLNVATNVAGTLSGGGEAEAPAQ